MREIDVSLTHSHTMAGAACVVGSTTTDRLEPLYTAAEMRAAEERYPRLPGQRARADGARRRRGRLRGRSRASPTRGRFAVVCGGGSNGGDGRVAARVCARQGATRRDRRVEGADVVVDALFGTGFHGDAAARGGGADRAHQRGRRAGRLGGRPVRRRRLDGRGRRRGGAGDADRHLRTGRSSGSTSHPARSTPGRSSWRTSDSSRPRPSIGS